MRFSRILSVTLAAAALSACSEGATAPTGTATVRVLYTASTAGPASLRIDNGASLTTLALFDTTTAATFQVAPGVRQFRVYGGADTTATVRANVSLTIREGERYTIVVRGNLPAAPAAQTLLTTVVQNLDFAFPVGTGQPNVGTGVATLPTNAAALRVIHAAGNANGTGVSNAVFGFVYPTATARPAAATISNASVTTAPTDWFYLSAGAYTVDIATSVAATTIRGTANVTLGAGDIRTVIVGDAATLPGVRFIVLNDRQ
jgi:hypothetical protein